jgi:hypothetical protein
MWGKLSSLAAAAQSVASAALDQGEKLLEAGGLGDANDNDEFVEATSLETFSSQAQGTSLREAGVTEATGDSLNVEGEKSRSSSLNSSSMWGAISSLTTGSATKALAAAAGAALEGAGKLIESADQGGALGGSATRSLFSALVADEYDSDGALVGTDPVTDASVVPSATSSRGDSGTAAEIDTEAIPLDESLLSGATSTSDGGTGMQDRGDTAGGRAEREQLLQALAAAQKEAARQRVVANTAEERARAADAAAAEARRSIADERRAGEAVLRRLGEIEAAREAREVRWMISWFGVMRRCCS